MQAADVSDPIWQAPSMVCVTIQDNPGSTRLHSPAKHNWLLCLRHSGIAQSSKALLGFLFDSPNFKWLVCVCVCVCAIIFLYYL
jgi:hypothetical protein